MSVVPTVPTTSMNTPIYVHARDDIVVYILIALAGISILIFAYRILTRTTRKTFVCVKISSGKSCMTIPLISIPYCPRFYHCTVEGRFSAQQISGWPKPTFSWNPAGLKIFNILYNSPLRVSTIFAISLYQAIELR